MKKRTLLIADDEAKIRNGIQTYLQLHAEFIDTIYVAENGAIALDIIYKYHPDVMLLDVQMPEKDGFEVMEEAIRAEVCPVTIILSGYDEFKYAQRALRAGVVDYILKPCRPNEIVEKLKEVLDVHEEETELEKKEQNPIVESAKKYMREHYDQEITLAMVADIVKVSPTYLSSIFTKYEECGFIDYLNQFRVDQAKMYLRDLGMKTYEVAYKVGFQDEKYFSRVFKKVAGVSPSEYKKG
ncbi:MAG: response regulator [Lachnospiraceae bacterium]|nr:response regulator [Lachnospiraceae bacterium]